MENSRAEVWLDEWGRRMKGQESGGGGRRTSGGQGVPGVDGAGMKQEGSAENAGVGEVEEQLGWGL